MPQAEAQGDGLAEAAHVDSPHRNRQMASRTPYKVFKAGIPAKAPALKKLARKEVKTAT